MLGSTMMLSESLCSEISGFRLAIVILQLSNFLFVFVSLIVVMLSTEVDLWRLGFIASAVVDFWRLCFITSADGIIAVFGSILSGLF